MVLSPSKPFNCLTQNDETSYIYWHHVYFRFVSVVTDTHIFMNDNERNIKTAFISQSSEALRKQYRSLTRTHELWWPPPPPPQASGVTANGRITLYPKVQDAHPKVRGHTIFPLSSTSLLGFEYIASKSAWPGSQTGAPVSGGLGLQVCFISLAPTGHPTFSSSILNGPQ